MDPLTVKHLSAEEKSRLSVPVKPVGPSATAASVVAPVSVASNVTLYPLVILIELFV